MMATSSALIIPLTLFFMGTRLWAVGKRFGHMTQVAFFRDRYDCSFIGTLIFLITAAMLLPYLIISITGGGTILSDLTYGRIPYAAGGAIVALIVMATVFFGGMRGAVWVNVLQTILFIAFGLIAFAWIGKHMPGGFTGAVEKMSAKANNPPTATAQGKMVTLLTRQRIPWQMFLSFMLIPLSSIMFPHMSMMCFTAKRVTAFKKTVVLYPICIMAIWLPCCYLGALGPSQDRVREAVAANSEPLKEWLADKGQVEKGEFAAELTALNGALHATAAGKLPPKAPPPLVKAGPIMAANAKALLADVAAGRVTPADASHRLYAIKSPTLQPAWNRVASQNSDSVLLEMLKAYVPKFLAGILAAGIISAVMGSDCHQILGLSTMFTKDIFNYYGHGRQMSERTVVHFGRAFIVIANGIAYIIALFRPPIFELAVTYAFSGFAALAPMMIAALFWRRSTKWAVLANTLWVMAWEGYMIFAEQHYHAGQHIWHNILFMSPTGKLSFMNFTPVMPMTIGAAILVVVVSLITRPPSRETIARYFSTRGELETRPAFAA
jgi:Na+/proline symporter